MKKTIYKYQINIADEVSIFMPLGAQIITAQEQHGVISLWAIVDESQTAKAERTIRIFGTGHPMPFSADISNWIATVQTNGGATVWHLFEL